MMPLTKEWVIKAEADFSSALLLLRSRKALYDSVRFHSQQCAEKYLKALLQHRDIRFDRTHDLKELAKLLTATDPECLLWLPQLEELTKSAVIVRYPGMSSTRPDARRAIRTAENIRDLIRRLLGLHSQAGKPRARKGKRKPAQRRRRSKG